MSYPAAVSGLALSASLRSAALPKGELFVETTDLVWIFKTSPFGRGGTEGDGEGEPV